MTIGCLVTTKDRPDFLRRSLPQITALGMPVLVVDDGSSIHKNHMLHPSMEDSVREICYENRAVLLRLQENRGLACALNIGLSYWLADKSIEWISYFQDDADVHPKCLEVLGRLSKIAGTNVLTGHDAAEHPESSRSNWGEYETKWKWAIRATHVHAHRDWWLKQMPFPTKVLGAPKVESGKRIGSDVDWYFCRDGANSCQKTNTPILCVPGLVRTFSTKAEDSCWNNAQRPEPPLREYA